MATGDAAVSTEWPHGCAPGWPYGGNWPGPGSWPQHFSVYGGEYPTGRGQQQTSGWTCPGCSRGYSPAVRQCGHCGPVAAEVTPPAQCGPGREGGMCDCDEPDD